MSKDRRGRYRIVVDLSRYPDDVLSVGGPYSRLDFSNMDAKVVSIEPCPLSAEEAVVEIRKMCEQVTGTTTNSVHHTQLRAILDRVQPPISGGQ